MAFAIEEARAIRAEFGDPVRYTGAGLVDAPIDDVVFSDVPADSFIGAGATARHVSFELDFVALPDTPDKGDVIAHETGRWSVIDVALRRDVHGWVLSVEALP